VVLSKATKKMRSRPVDAVIAWRTQTMAVGDMMAQLIQLYEETGVGLEASFPHCGVKGKHLGDWSPQYARNQILRPDLRRLQAEGMGVLSELDIDSEVVLRCSAPVGSHIRGFHGAVRGQRIFTKL
jgi:hypothetical protein